MSGRRPGGAPGRLRRLAAPRSSAVHEGPDGRPAAVGDARVEAVIEEWVIEDRWWTAAPLRRRYVELVLADGRNMVVFRDLRSGRWFEQRT